MINEISKLISDSGSDMPFFLPVMNGNFEHTMTSDAPQSGVVSYIKFQGESSLVKFLNLSHRITALDAVSSVLDETDKLIVKWDFSTNGHTNRIVLPLRNVNLIDEVREDWDADIIQDGFNSDDIEVAVTLMPEDSKAIQSLQELMTQASLAPFVAYAKIDTLKGTNVLEGDDCPFDVVGAELAIYADRIDVRLIDFDMADGGFYLTEPTVI